MTDTQAEERTVVVERDMPYPPEKIWCALTEAHLLEEWLMKNDFKPVVDHSFKFSADWGSVDCQVLAVQPNKSLSYTWGAFGMGTVVTWTLIPTGAGTRLCMEQAGFPLSHERAFQGAKMGWPRFFAGLEQVLARID